MAQLGCGEHDFSIEGRVSCQTPSGAGSIVSLSASRSLAQYDCDRSKSNELSEMCTSENEVDRVVVSFVTVDVA